MCLGTICVCHIGTICACRIGRQFDASYDHDDAQKYLKDMGIKYETRDVDNSKRYGESITVV